MIVWGMSDRGIVRAENQDMFLVDALHDQNQAVLAVCDGMGGANAGNVASEIAIHTFSEELKNTLKPSMSTTYMKNVAIAAVTEANARVYSKSNESKDFSGMGTTLVAALIDGNKAVIVNVGDSRAYLAGSTGIQKITKDHSLVEEMLTRGDITEEQARVHPNKNLITRGAWRGTHDKGGFLYGHDQKESISASLLRRAYKYAYRSGNSNRNSERSTTRKML